VYLQKGELAVVSSSFQVFAHRLSELAWSGQADRSVIPPRWGLNLSFSVVIHKGAT
jgi:hypothetical protein